jgi:hypothetical protein
LTPASGKLAASQRGIIVLTEETKFILHLIAGAPRRVREFQKICRTEPALTSRQRGDSVFRCEVSPAQWNLALAALLVEKTYSLFAAMLFATESFKLTTRERMKGMGDVKLL